MIRSSLLLACLMACSGEKTRPTGPGFEPASSETSVPAQPSPSATTTAPPATDAGDGLAMVIEPDTPCSPRGGASTIVSAPDTRKPGFVGLAQVGARLVGELQYQQGFMVLDSTLSGPFSLGDVNRIAVSETDVAVVALSGPTDVLFGRLDLAGNLLGSSLTLSSDHPSDVAVGRAGARSLAMWSTLYDVRARGITDSGALAGEAFALESATAKDSFTAAIVDDGNGAFAIAWSDRRLSDGHFVTRFAFATTTGVSGLVHVLFDTTEPMAVVALVKRSTGYSLLVDYGKPALATVVSLDRAGKLAAPARAFAGSSGALGMASQSGELAVLAIRADRSIELRALAGDGKPLAPWVCLDAPSSVDPSAAIDAEGTGYTVVYTAPDAAQTLVRLDRLGTGVP